MKDAVYKRILWDYNIPKSIIEQLLSGKISNYSGITKEKIELRLLQRLSWEELVDLLGLDTIKKILQAGMYKSLRDPLQRIKYEQILRLLQGKTLSFSGWDPENRERIKSTLLSDRWDRP